MRSLNLSYNSLHFKNESITYVEPSKAALRRREKKKITMSRIATPTYSTTRSDQEAPRAPQDEWSVKFAMHLREIISTHDRLVHLNCSGMGLTRRPLS